MENQAKVIVIERNKFASLVKSHRKCLQMLNILTYIYTVKEVSLTLTLQEICEVLHICLLYTSICFDAYGRW